MTNEQELVSKLPGYYAKSLSIFQDFGGPSVYFHIQAIKEQQNEFMSLRHIEMIYATLASWGMHRMGDPEVTRAKMTDFKVFEASLMGQCHLLSQFRGLRMEECTESEYGDHLDALEGCYKALRVSISDATLVAHSKALAHVLPNLIPPIDRQYTVRFFTQENKRFFRKSGQFRLVNLPAGIDRQFLLFRTYCQKIKRLLSECDKRMFAINPCTFNTSYPKIMDNLIMAFVKSVPRPAKRAKTVTDWELAE